jgi:hypothetical protein
MSHSGERRTDSLVKSAVSFGIGQRRESIRAGRIESAWGSTAPQTRRERRGVECADACGGDENGIAGEETRQDK